ncbi:MAG: calcium/sodium antiporter [Clostridia bacterium]|nr:calcium/sodium antiporter [Clostridia bacterium]
MMIVFLVLGFVLLVKGADFFVDGACDLSDRLKIPAYVVGLTVVAFGTSLPEAAVSITASLQHSNEIAIGNVIGSNMFNTLVVLGASALFSPIVVKSNLLKKDFPFCIIITVVMLILMLTMGGGQIALTRIDGIILLVIFAVFMIMSIAGAKKAAPMMAETVETKNVPLWKSILFIVVGAAGVILGGQLTVTGAKSLAEFAGLSEKVIALTVVAIGTSLPELVTSIVASRKDQNDIAVGNAIGSNIFNILFILGISATIGTITTDVNAVIDACALIGIVGLTYVFALAKKSINRVEGGIMILVYIAYTVYLLMR